MTRNEAMQKAAEKEANYVYTYTFQDMDDLTKLFKKGVKWADKHPDGSQKFLDLACKWIRDNIDRYDNSIGLTKDEFIDEFCKYANEEL